jgi:D-alanyl-D-alanine carboxypeptidase
MQAAHLLEQGFASSPLSWLTPSLGSVESLTPVDAAPLNLHEEMCGAHRKRPAAEEEDQEVNDGPADSPYAVFLSSLRPPAKGGANLLQTEANLGEPVVVFTGPARGQGANLGVAQGAAPAGTAQIAAVDAKSLKPAKPGAKTAVANPVQTVSSQSVAAAPPSGGAVSSGPAVSGGQAIASVSAVPWTSMSPAALAVSPPSALAATPADSAQLVPLPRARPRVAVEKLQLR